MRTLNDTGLIRVEAHQWPAVRQKLLPRGYKLLRSDGRSNPATLWTPDGRSCVGQYHPEDRCYYLDARLLRPYLPRPLGRPTADDPWTDLGGEG